jgi:hypothetical protein
VVASEDGAQTRTSLTAKSFVDGMRLTLRMNTEPSSAPEIMTANGAHKNRDNNKAIDQQHTSSSIVILGASQFRSLAVNAFHFRRKI